MNYNDEILENKEFKFFKQLMYNIALSLCIMLAGVLILVYGFKFGLYEVLSNSQAPYFVRGDLVVVKPQKEYEVGDIIKFNKGKTPITHRLVGIHEENGIAYYICHGDNVDNLDGSEKTKSDWEDDAEFIKNYIDSGKTISDIKGLNVDVISSSQVEGKVIGHLDNYGTYMKFVKGHSVLVISLLAGIWCISNVIQNEIDIKKCRRLFK